MEKINILVILLTVGIEFLTRRNPNVENACKFRNYTCVEWLYELIGKYVDKFNLRFPYAVPSCLALLIFVVSLLGYLSLGALFSALVLFYCFRELPDNAAENIFIEFNERYFANLLYFVLFGPLGPFVVLLYNFTAIARLNHSELVKVHAILAWLPARLASFSFALVGNFAPVTRTWLSAVANVQVSSSKILTDCGQASVDVDEKQVAERSLVAWAILCIIVVIMK